MIDTILSYRPWGQGIEARCRARIFRREDGRAAVIVTELPDNPGMSVTNAAEWIATTLLHRYDLDPNDTIWIEHYPDRHPPGMEGERMFDETFDLIRFRWEDEGRHRAPMRLSPWARTPDWRHLDREEVEELVGRRL